MKTSSELFDLIKALNKQDKKNFRQELQSNKQDKKTLRLYDIIDKQKAFDDETAQKKMGNFKWYSRLKNYLAERITTNLLNSIPEKESQEHVLRLITLAEILKSKGLPELAKKRLELANDICEKYDWIAFQPLITHKICIIIEDEKKELQFHDQYLKYYNELGQFYLNKKYWFLFRLLEYSISIGKNMNRDFLKFIDIKDILKEESKLTTYAQKLSYFQFLCSYYKNIEVDYEKSFLYIKKPFEATVDRIEESFKSSFSLDQQKNLLRDFVVVTTNSINGALIINDIPSLDKLLTIFIQYENRMSINKNIHAFYIQFKYYNYFMIAATKITRAGIKSIDFSNWISEFKTVENKLPPRITFFNFDLISLYYFMSERFHECQSSVNLILNDTNTYKQNKDIYSGALVLQLFLDFETDETDRLDSDIKKAERYFENHYSILDYQKIIITFFNKIRQFGDKESWKKIMIEFRNNIITLKESNKNLQFPYQMNIIFIDFEGWLESKIAKVSFVKLIHDRFHKKQI
ncbi:MAG: hypothetical protein JNL63_12110 [Bacteroidia bacterium]|nr:hypothetical protein [Bacteroidia bacterium]